MDIASRKVPEGLSHGGLTLGVRQVFHSIFPFLRKSNVLFDGISHRSNEVHRTPCNAFALGLDRQLRIRLKHSCDLPHRHLGLITLENRLLVGVGRSHALSPLHKA